MASTHLHSSPLRHATFDLFSLITQDFVAAEHGLVSIIGISLRRHEFEQQVIRHSDPLGLLDPGVFGAASFHGHIQSLHHRLALKLHFKDTLAGLVAFRYGEVGGSIGTVKAPTHAIRARLEDDDRSDGEKTDAACASLWRHDETIGRNGVDPAAEALAGSGFPAACLNA